MEKIYCLGDICPIPIMKLQKKMTAIKNGASVQLITDHSCTVTTLAQFCKAHHLVYVANEVISGVWEIEISNK
ncbi:MAG: SirA family protein [Clostridia bacterium]|nr:SirA family protein [Clostridia bacterium]